MEAAGLSTVTLSNVPDLTLSVSPPRVVAIEYPLGRTLGAPGDGAGQLRVLRDTLRAAANMTTPGDVVHLPYEWPEPKAKARTHPPEPPPISVYLSRHPWQLPRLFNRDVPDDL